MAGYPIWQVVAFLLIDFVIIASLVACAIFLFLFFRTRKYKKTTVVNLNDLDAFKNKNLQMETSISLENSKPVAPSTIKRHSDEDSYYSVPQYTAPPMRTHGNEAQKMFNCQMQQTQQQMSDNFVAQQQLNNQPNPTNYFNM